MILSAYLTLLGTSVEEKRPTDGEAITPIDKEGREENEPGASQSAYAENAPAWSEVAQGKSKNRIERNKYRNRAGKISVLGSLSQNKPVSNERV